MRETISTLPSPEVCEQARRSRDPRFDGLFFTAVRSTKIYCRPVCPARWAAQVEYFASAAEAEVAGYRPCLRCRPELAPGQGAWPRGDALVARALQLLDDGHRQDESLAGLARELGVGERQLRRHFVTRVGAPPGAIRATRRLLFAKQLLTDTRLPISRVALESGFQSLRRFNDAFRTAYRMAPRDLRRKPVTTADDALTIRLAYRPPYDFDAHLAFLRKRAIPGIERVDDTSYAHTLTQGRDGSLTWFDVRACPTGEPALLLNVHGDAATNLLQLVATVRRMFDLDADPCVVRAALERSAVLRPLVKRAPGVRIPGAFDAFEVAVRAVLGQQVTVAAGNTFLARLIDATRPAGAARDAVPGLWRVFPSPSRVADANLDSIGLTAARARTVRALAAGFIDGTLTSVPGQTLDEFVRPWTSVPGIGPWTAHYIALRALGHPDAFPPRDVALQRALHALGGSESDAESWRPWRGYAVIHLWRWDGDPGPLAARK